MTVASIQVHPRTGISPDMSVLPILSTGGCGGKADERSACTDDFLLDLLREQQQLTAVEEFSQFHDQSKHPAQSKYYAALLPAAPPGPGEQYAFEVNLDACSGCKACVVGCHSLNGLDESEIWRDVGLLIGGTAANPVMQHVTTACHHCLEPACMVACPVDAYEKDAITGIVRHLDDQCFGCQYCTLACPYDVPKYHSGKGIVRKCDMCTDRLAVGEAPACVQACPHEAIRIRVVNVAEVKENAEVDPFLPAAPDPYITYPTTVYKSQRIFPRNSLPADYFSINPQHPHWPLIIMLVLTQLSFGTFTVGQLLGAYLQDSMLEAFRPVLAALSLILGLVALTASTLHLGRPQYAFRAIIGLRHSWLSREILAFGLFAGIATLYAGIVWSQGVPVQFIHSLGWAVVVSGGLGVFCSAMIYVFTQREFWNFGRTITRFLLTSLVLGLSTSWLALLLTAAVDRTSASNALLLQVRQPLAISLMSAVAIKLAWESGLFLHLLERRYSPLKRSALLILGPLANYFLARVAFGALGGLVMPAFILSRSNVLMTPATGFDLQQVTIVVILFLACLMGELLERFLFFAAVSAARMPGGPRA